MLQKIIKLPNEIWARIFELLDPYKIIIKFTCIQWNLLVDNEIITPISVIRSPEFFRQIPDEATCTLFEQFCRAGNLEMVQWLYSTDHDYYRPLGLSNAILSENLELVQYLVSLQPIFLINESVKNAVRSTHFNSVEVLKYLLSRGFDLHMIMVTHILLKPNLEILKYLYSINWKAIEYTETKYLTESCNLNIVKWAKEIGRDFNGVEIIFHCSSEAQTNILELIQWLINNGAIWVESSFRYVIKCNDLAAILWLHEHGYGWEPYIMQYTYQYCNLEIIKWFVEHGVQLSPAQFAIAVAKNNIEMVTWLYTQDFYTPLKLENFTNEIRSLDMLIWFKNQNCNFNERMFMRAASVGGEEGFKMMKWLWANNCPMDQFTVLNSVGNLKTLQWLKAINCPGFEGPLFELASGHKNIKILQWLKNIGCPWCDAAYQKAAFCENMKALRWFKEMGYPCTLATLRSAISGSNNRVARWLINNISPI